MPGLPFPTSRPGDRGAARASAARRGAHRRRRRSAGSAGTSCEPPAADAAAHRRDRRPGRGDRLALALGVALRVVPMAIVVGALVVVNRRRIGAAETGRTGNPSRGRRASCLRSRGVQRAAARRGWHRESVRAALSAARRADRDAAAVAPRARRHARRRRELCAGVRGGRTAAGRRRTSPAGRHDGAGPLGELHPDRGGHRVVHRAHRRRHFASTSACCAKLRAAR